MATGISVGRKHAHGIFEAVADAVASADIDQLDREQLAAATADAFEATKLAPHFVRDLFVLLASDPLSPCVGFDRDGVHHPCPHERRIRIGMHLSSAPDGRSAAWRERRPEVRCVTCGARHFNPAYPLEAAS